MATAVPMLPWASSGQAGVASAAAQSSQAFDAQAAQPSLPEEEPPGTEEAVPPPPPNPAPAQAPAQAPQAQQAQQAPDQAQQHAQAWAYWNAQQVYYQQYGARTAPRCCSPLWPGFEQTPSSRLGRRVPAVERLRPADLAGACVRRVRKPVPTSVQLSPVEGAGV